MPRPGRNSVSRRDQNTWVTPPSGLTTDTGALIAVERGDRRLRVLLDETERAGWPVVVRHRVVTSDPQDFALLDPHLPMIVV